MPIANLLPDDYKAKRECRRAMLMCVLLTPLVLGLVVAAMLLSRHTLDKTMSVRDAVAQSYSQAQDVVYRLRAAEARRAAMIEQSQANASLLEKVPRSCSLAMVINCLPPQTSITRFEFDSRPSMIRRPAAIAKPAEAGSSPEAAADNSPPGPEVRIAGMAATDVGVGKLIANLSRERLVAAVSLQYSQAKSDGSGIREFQILMELKSNPPGPNPAAAPAAVAGARDDSAQRGGDGA